MNNKQTMEKTMKKIAMIISVLAVLGTSAQAGYFYNGKYCSMHYNVLICR
jgi:multisubunit Na+/H+ antiporter MnhF subunit